MLAALHVANYILIDSLEIVFPEGLVIITGQTGAGKSILLGALSLVLGSKADAGVIGSHGESCVVEAEFVLKDDSPAREILEANDLDWEGGHLLIRRVVNSSGRSRSFINDLPVTLPVLQELSAYLVDIHSQHQNLLLADPAFRLRSLDLYAGNSALLEESGNRWNALSALRRERETLIREIGQTAAEREYNLSQLRQLEEAALREGEVEELEAEQKQLANAEEIKENLFAVQEGFAPSEGERESLDVLLKESERRLEKISRFIPETAQLAERLGAARIELDDILAETESINARTELNAGRLEAVEDRLSFLYGLLKKHACTTVGELIARRDSYADSLSGAEGLQERLAETEKALKAEETAYETAAQALHKARVAAAPVFADAVGKSLRFLELDRSLFRVDVVEAAPGERGRDAVQFLFSANGAAPTDLSKCASGGEMSRIMLSLKAEMASFTAMPTLIFDEIDTGVSGSAADRMGSMICSMGADMQVFAITHLPQVAAKGDAHYLVEKNDAVTSIRRIGGEDRVSELARMLSGSVVTPEAVANARALLGGR